MRKTNRWRAPLLVTILAFPVVRCTMSADPSIARDPAPMHHVIVDGSNVPAVRGSLLDLLRKKLPPNRMNLLSTGYTNSQPLIVIDGVRLVGGSRLLAEITTLDVKRVTTFHAVDAYVLYGPDGYAGAIVVETLTGR